MKKATKIFAQFALTAMFLLVGESSMAQSIVHPPPKANDWSQLESSSSIDYQVVPNAGLILRPSEPNKSMEQALRKHLVDQVKSAVKRDLTPAEREATDVSVNKYLWNHLAPVEIKKSDRLSNQSVNSIGYKLQVKSTFDKVMNPAMTKFAKEFFDSDEFKNASIKKRLELLSQAVDKAALSPQFSNPDGRDGINYAYTPSVEDIIRTATPEQLGYLIDLDDLQTSQPFEDSYSTLIVAPGVPISDDEFGSGPCTGNFCGSPERKIIPLQMGSKHAAITYRENSYENVVVLQPFTTSDSELKGLDPTQNRCTATLIASSWVLSALHCFGIDGKSVRNSFEFKSVVKKWMALTPIRAFMGARNAPKFAISFKRNGQIYAYLVRKVYIPYVDEYDINYSKGGVPSKDIALIKIDEIVATNVLKYPEFAAENLVVPNTAVTFIGYGWTEVTNYDWRKSKQATFNWLTAADSNSVQWQTGNLKGNGGPCRGDSGGPIYLDFFRGYKEDRERLVGVVSNLLTDKVENPEHCLKATGEGEPLHPYIAGICDITEHALVGCQ